MTLTHYTIAVFIFPPPAWTPIVAVDFSKDVSLNSFTRITVSANLAKIVIRVHPLFRMGFECVVNL